MLDILKNFDATTKSKSKTATSADKNSMQSILESFNRVGEAPMPVPAPAAMPQEPQGQPVSMNVSLNASGKDHVDDLLKLMQNAGLSGAGQVGPSDTKLDVDMDGDNQPDIALMPKEESIEEADEDQLRSWYKKYNQYDSADIGSLADGMFKFFQDSGVDLDTVEKSEYDALVAKHGEDKILGNALRFLSDEDTPITKAMFDEFERIMGEPADEESSEKAVSLLGLDESQEDLNSIRRLSGLEEVVVGGNAEPEDPDSVFARLMSDISEIQNAAMDDNDMADDIADELGDYLRNGDAPEGSHYEKAIGIVMDAIHDGPQAQAEAAEEAISFLHSAEEEARGNNESYANSPDGSPDEEEYKDTQYMTKDLSGGLNREKKMYAKAQDGDNAMAVESIKDMLYRALEEKKSKKGDGNLANNYPPYDKVTRGDIIAGATGKDQKGGKKKK